MNYKEIKKAREEKGLTQVDVAIACDVSLAGYRLWETGAGRPTEKNLEKLKKALSVK